MFWRSVRARWLGYVAALAAVAVVSGFIGLVLREVNLANVSMLYLLAVLATAVAYGRGPAVFASIVAFLTFDWFFVDPIHHFTVSDPEEWVSPLSSPASLPPGSANALGKRSSASARRSCCTTLCAWWASGISKTLCTQWP